MEDIAVQLFNLGDQEHKGFIVKRDMQRLQSEVELPPDQLEAVFESLDSSHNGYLTLDQFLAGVNHFGSNGESVSRAGSEPDLYVQRLLSLNVLHKSGELVCEVRDMVSSEDTWHQMLAALFSDLNQLLRQISQLEEKLRSRDHHHQEELQRLYEEFESQMLEEREGLNKQLHQKESALRSELAAELAGKEQQLSELTEQRDELQARLTAAHAELSSRRPSIPQCKPEVERIKTGRSSESQQSLRRAELRADRSYAEGFSHAHHLALLQEAGLVKQLRLLQEMQKNLKSGAREERHRNFTYDDL